MKNLIYTMTIGNNKIQIVKNYRTITQFEYYLTIFMSDGKTESIHLYQTMHLTKKSAIKEAIRVTSKSLRVEKVIY